MRRRLEPSLSIRAIRPVFEGLSNLGHDTVAIMSVLGLSSRHLEDDEFRLPHQSMMRFWRVIEEASDDPFIGIHAAESVTLDRFDVHAYAILSSEDYISGLLRAARYQRLIHDTTTIDCREVDKRVTIRHALPGGTPVPRLPAQYLMTLWVRFGQAMLGEKWQDARAVRLAHARPARIEEYLRVFGPALQFDSGENALVLSRRIARYPNPARDTCLVEILDRYALGLIDARRKRVGAPYSAKVEEMLDTLMDGVPSVRVIAQGCLVSVRTLHRRLSEEGTGYREIVERTRHRRATAMLLQSDASVAEIAFLLGFSETRAFRAAFRRWTGVTPADYRRNAQRQS